MPGFMLGIDLGKFGVHGVQVQGVLGSEHVLVEVQAREIKRAERDTDLRLGQVAVGERDGQAVGAADDRAIRVDLAEIVLKECARGAGVQSKRLGAGRPEILKNGRIFDGKHGEVDAAASTARSADQSGAMQHREIVGQTVYPGTQVTITVDCGHVGIIPRMAGQRQWLAQRTGASLRHK